MRRGPAIFLILVLTVVVVGFWFGGKDPAADVPPPEEPAARTAASTFSVDPSAGDAPEKVPDGSRDAGGSAEAAPVVRGQVTDSEGNPVRGASVQIDGGIEAFDRVGMFGREPPKWMPAGPDGRFEVPLPGWLRGTKHLEVLAKAPGYAPGVRAIPAGGNALDVDVALAEGATLELIVVEEGTNVPVPRATLHLGRGIYERNFVHLDGTHTPNWLGYIHDLPPAAVSDARGRITLEDLAPGGCWLFVKAPGFDFTRIASIEIPPDDPVRVELHRKPFGVIRGVVEFADGTPVHWARVVVPTGDPGKWRGFFTGADGSFYIDGLTPGSHTLVLAPMGPVNFDPKRVPDVPTGAGTVRIVVDRGLSLRGRLMDPAGEPAVDVEVHVRGSLMLTTDEEGRFRVDGLEEKPHRVEVNLRRYYGVRELLVREIVPSGGEVVIVGPERHDLAGVVVDEEGRALAGLRVRATGKSDDQWATTDEDGSFRFRHLCPGEYGLWIKGWKCAPDRADSGRLDVRLRATK